MRVYVQDTLLHTVEAVSIAASPLLLYNMGDPASLQVIAVTIPDPSSDASFPVARTVNIARIASEHSMHKKYQHLFLTALKAYFRSRKRIFKQGDIVAVPIEEGLARYIGDEGEKENFLEDEEDPFEYVELSRPRYGFLLIFIFMNRLPMAISNPTAVAYFRLTQLEGSPTQSSSLDPLARGDFGFYIDPHSTIMVQTGLENSRVPNIAGFLGLGKFLTQF